jgi:hypothetical protein
MVGRDIELGRLRRALEDLSVGRGGAVLVEGEPGIGKSALVDAVVVAATTGRSAGVEVLRVGPDEDGSGNYDQPGHDQLLDRVVRSGGVLGSGLGPVVIIFEDLHAADDGALSLWRRLSRLVGDAPVLLVGTRRPVPQRPAVDRLRREVADGDGLVLALGGLASAGVAALAAGLTQATPGPDLLEHLEAAAGNPRYIRELINVASDSGALQTTDGVAELKEPSARPALEGSITDRLDFVQPATLEALRGAALLESRFAVADLALITMSTPVELVPVIDEAMVSGLIESAGNLLRFRHPVIRQALHELTPPRRRTELHRRAARALAVDGAQPQRVARRLLAGAGTGAAAEPWETDWLAEYGETLTRREPAMAVQLLERAVIELSDPDPRRDVFEDLLADAEFRLFRFERAVRIAAGNAARSTEPDRIGRNTWLLGYSLLRLRRLDDLLRALDEAAARPEASPLSQPPAVSAAALADPAGAGHRESGDRGGGGAGGSTGRAA